MNLRNSNKLYIFACIALFIFGLSVPKISELLLAILVILIFAKHSKSMSFPKGFIIKSHLLLAFSFTYYLIMYHFDLVSLKDMIVYVSIINVMYFLGFTVNLSRSSGPEGMLWILIAMVAGFVVFTFLTVNQESSWSSAFDVDYYKAIPSYWAGGEPINRPGLGALASLGICLAPFLFYKIEDQKRTWYIVKVVILIISLTGIYLNIILSNRAPFIALAVAILASIAVFLTRKIPRKVKRRFIFKTFFSAALVMFALIYSGINIEKLYILQRFTEEGLNSAGRVDTWLIVLGDFFRSIYGGRVIYLGGNSFVHNLWLDVVWDAGIFPFFFLVLYHLSHLKELWIIYRSRLSVHMLILVACIGISFFATMMQEPTMTASPNFFSASCFYLGSLAALSLEVQRKRDSAFVNF